ncbi:flavin reductase [Pseudomonas daroniae]|uniref:Flavin reductase n=2 Tax=Pseudomonadales TaxID=72274 RepID=A0A4Q9QGB4_9GAMM|nr:flavin reductase [Pseudomonas daroniae]TBU74273.1 flavin reductase [Pseudomonas sp. FRB 228]TBU86544.1 flavin reductase [Pseudomonas daroniae]
MRRLAASVSVITCTHEDQWFGLTATAVTSLCAEPASIITCINSSASMVPALTASQHFCVNVLRSEHVAVSSSFGGRLKGAERFCEGTWHAGENGVPYLADAQVNLFCEVETTLAYGTHIVVIGRVKALSFAEEISPLIYQNGLYVGTAPLAAAV